jgi:hypothetical protein
MCLVAESNLYNTRFYGLLFNLKKHAFIAHGWPILGEKKLDS